MTVREVTRHPWMCVVQVPAQLLHAINTKNSIRPALHPTPPSTTLHMPLNGKINGNIVVGKQPKQATRAVIIKGILEQKRHPKISAKHSRKVEISAKIHIPAKKYQKNPNLWGQGG